MTLNAIHDINIFINPLKQVCDQQWFIRFWLSVFAFVMRRTSLVTHQCWSTCCASSFSPQPELDLYTNAVRIRSQ